ncbi:hypothetical protein VTN49DRAFT_3686 [Thermomyces lanuginosus]|uniref:uncharacterized protein n=1 Tax=Thermomyces lanuginosus TaxID=5541 RepID=UPI003742C619
MNGTMVFVARRVVSKRNHANGISARLVALRYLAIFGEDRRRHRVRGDNRARKGKIWNSDRFPVERQHANASVGCGFRACSGQ